MNRRVPTNRHRGRVLTVLAATAMLALTGCKGGDLVSYDLPSKSARYTFETRTDDVKTVWEYTSAEVTKNDTSRQSPCLGELTDGDTTPCRPEPLIFLRYDFGLDLANTAASGRKHEVTVVAYYQERLTTPPKVTSLKAEATFDGGRTWRSAATKAGATNTYTVTIDNPRREQAANGVGLRISATNSQGDTVRQTIPTAYALR